MGPIIIGNPASPFCFVVNLGSAKRDVPTKTRSIKLRLNSVVAVSVMCFTIASEELATRRWP